MLVSLSTAAPAAEARDDAVAALLARLAALEERVQRQEEELGVLRRGAVARPPPPPSASAAASSAAPAGPPPSPAPAAPPPPIANVGETADAWSESHAPMLTLRGFGDVQYRRRNGPTDSNGFNLGQLDLFITSRITDELQLLSENVIKINNRNETAIEAERLLVRYAPNDYFSIAAGRYHSTIGFFNTAYHHGSWFQTSIGRPLPFRGEDQGGVLPIHNVGITMSGQVPGPAHGLHYTVEVGNGRDYRPGARVQQAGDFNSQKALNLALVWRPDALPGFQAGAAVYTDRPLTPTGAAVRQNILALHLVYQRPTMEWLNEIVALRHAPSGAGSTRQTWGYYSQFGYSFGAFRPYLRYHLIDVARNDPVLSTTTAPGRSHGPSVGVRYNLSNFTALKLQFDRLIVDNAPTTEDLTLQWAFTF